MKLYVKYLPVVQVGHVDFRPNSGKSSQPGCKGHDGISLHCSHLRAPVYGVLKLIFPKNNLIHFPGFLFGEHKFQSRLRGVQLPVLEGIQSMLDAN